jgi:hypothetical protein
MSPMPASQLVSKPHVEVAAAIIFHDGQILISQRDEDHTCRDIGSFPAERENPTSRSKSASCVRFAKS